MAVNPTRLMRFPTKLPIDNIAISGYLSCSNFTVSGHYTGFPDRDATSLGWNDGTATFTLTATADPIWISGVSYTIDTLTKQLPSGQGAASGLYWFWLKLSAGAIVLDVSTTPTDMFGLCLVAAVYWNTTTNKGLLTDERHWMGRDKWMHKYLHESVGARFSEGMGGTFDDTTMIIEAGAFYDEDIEHANVQETVCTVLYHNGDADWAWVTGQTTPYKTNAGVLQYNNGNALADADNNKYVDYWMFITPDTTDPVWIIIGTQQHVLISSAREEGVPSFGQLPTEETKLIYRLIYRNVGGSPSFIEATDFRATPETAAAVTTDHGSLAGLGDDDHGQYWIAGADRTGNFSTTGQVGIGITAGTEGSDFEIAGSMYLADGALTYNLSSGGIYIYDDDNSIALAAGIGNLAVEVYGDSEFNGDITITGIGTFGEIATTDINKELNSDVSFFNDSDYTGNRKLKIHGKRTADSGFLRSADFLINTDGQLEILGEYLRGIVLRTGASGIFAPSSDDLTIGNRNSGVFNIGGDGSDSVMAATNNNLVYRWLRADANTQQITFEGVNSAGTQEYFNCDGHNNSADALTTFSTDARIQKAAASPIGLAIQNLTVNEDAYMDLMETNTAGFDAFGTSGAYGFRTVYDGGTNEYQLISGSGVTTNTRLTITRDTGNFTFAGSSSDILFDLDGAYPMINPSGDGLRIDGVMSIGTTPLTSYQLTLIGVGTGSKTTMFLKTITSGGGNKEVVRSILNQAVANGSGGTISSLRGNWNGVAIETSDEAIAIAEACYGKVYGYDGYTATVNDARGFAAFIDAEDATFTEASNFYGYAPVKDAGEIGTFAHIWLEDPAGVAGTTYAIYSLGGDVELTDGAISTAGIITDGGIVHTPSAAQVIDAAADTILANATMIVLNPDGNYTMTSTPTIANGTTGQIVHITCANAEANAVTVQDEAALGSSNLRLGGATRIIRKYSVLTLMFDGVTWNEQSYALN